MSLPKSTQIQREMAHIGGVQMELLGRAGSEAGIQLLAVGGMPNQKMENHVTTSVRFFSYLPRIAVDGQVCIDGGGFEPARPLNFIAPGALMGTKGGGVTGALCVFNEKFMTHLVEIERDFHFAKIGCLTSIEFETIDLSWPGDVARGTVTRFWQCAFRRIGGDGDRARDHAM